MKTRVALRVVQHYFYLDSPMFFTFQKQGSWEYCLVKARDAMNRRQDERLIIVETAIHRVFVMIHRVFAI